MGAENPFVLSRPFVGRYRPREFCSAPVRARSNGRRGHRAQSSCPGTHPPPRRQCRVQPPAIARCPRLCASPVHLHWSACQHPPLHRPSPPLFFRWTMRSIKRVVIIAMIDQPARRSQPNRLKCNHHVTYHRPIHPSPNFSSDFPHPPPPNFPLFATPSRPPCIPDFLPAHPGTPITAFASRSRASPPIKVLDLRQLSASAPFEQFQNADWRWATVSSKEVCRPATDES